jgi:long-chain acyl-CoA synthetase
MLMHRLLVAAAERHFEKLAFRWVDRARSLSYGAAAEAMDEWPARFRRWAPDRVTIFALITDWIISSPCLGPGGSALSRRR